MSMTPSSKTPTSPRETTGPVEAKLFSGVDPPLEWDETLSDGTRVRIRPIRKEDAALEREFIERLSPRSIEYRFLGQMHVSDEMIRRLTDIDYLRDMAFVALYTDGGKTREIGVSRYCVSNDGASCECAGVVADEWQGKGLGHLLMRHLIEVARQRGIKRMFSIDVARNQEMLRLAKDLGFERKVELDDPNQVIYSLSL